MTQPKPPRIIYVSGPMTGKPNFNFPAFHSAARTLRSVGYEVLNPAEEPERDSWIEYLRHDVGLLSHADAICSLPGWGESRGATVEHAVASMLGIESNTVAHWVRVAQRAVSSGLVSVAS